MGSATTELTGACSEYFLTMFLVLKQVFIIAATLDRFELYSAQRVSAGVILTPVFGDLAWFSDVHNQCQAEGLHSAAPSSR